MIHYRLCETGIQCVSKTGGFSMNITFDDNLITGNKTIDSQHQELIDRIRQFVAACESSDSKIKAIKMLDYLDEYTNFHFQEEEDLQKKYLTRNLPHIMPNMKNSRNPFRNYMIILMKTKDLMISLSNR